MEQFISIIVFSLPGLLVYFWIQALGMNPTVKHSPAELAGIAALFWIPTVLLTAVTFNLAITHVSWEWLGFNLPQINTLDDLQQRISDARFALYFFLSSIVFSFLVAFLWIIIYHSIVLRLINWIRVARKIAKLSDTTSVWDAFFLKFSKRKEESMLVEIYKLDKPDQKIIGSITKMSRPYEPERALVLEKISEATESHQYYVFESKRSYVDVKSGVVVTELDLSKPTANVDELSSSSEALGSRRRGDRRS